jgi:hypothetical protein
LLATFLTAVPVLGGGKLADLVPPYTTANITGLLNDEQAIKELKITKDQTAAIKKIVEKSQKNSSGDADKIYKMPEGPDKYPKIRALTAQRAEQLFQDLGKTLSSAQVKRLKQIMLQLQGITVFEHPEIRAQLKLSDADVTRLTAEYDRLKKQIQQQALAGKIAMKNANDRLKAMSTGIPDGVRAELNEQQRKTLQELLGEPYTPRK